ncbi:MAG: sigma-70 family RNA polymerase sigma factor [Oscillospiraceae bacterium]|nr:sigma-70 family RNA polymerase sigma factor [Oscillospiraceae bacterium]
MISEIIAKSQEGDNDATLFLVNRFNPLLKKYSRMLYYEDAYNDLLVDFLEMTKSMQINRIYRNEDAGVVSYIATSIHNSYIKRLIQIKHYHAIILYSDLTEDEQFHIESICSTVDKYSEYDYSTIKNILTESEMSIITSIYFMGYTVAETSHFYGISRQAINQTKLRALEKLKKLYSDKPDEVRT